MVDIFFLIAQAYLVCYYRSRNEKIEVIFLADILTMPYKKESFFGFYLKKDH